MTAVAAIDLGTNSVLCLVADVRDGAVAVLDDRCIITRLGEGVDATGELGASAIDRTLSALLEHASVVRSHEVVRLAAVGTSALRDARNAESFLCRAREIIGAPVEVISGEREALLTFRGATMGLAIEGDVCVLDVGGGSTEIVEGRAAPRRARSLDIGSVRLTERFLHSDPPTPAQREALRDTIRQALADAREVLRPTMVGVAGTVTTLAAVHLGISRYSRDAIHGQRLSSKELRALVDSLAALRVDERAKLPGMPLGRAHPILAGAEIVLSALDAAHAEELIVSDGGVRYGLAQELVAAPRG